MRLDWQRFSRLAFCVVEIPAKCYKRRMELPDARNKFPQVRQFGWAWCIPASFEVLLHYFDMPNPTQKDMVAQYNKSFGADGYAEPVQVGNQWKLRPVKLTNPTIDQLRNYGFPKANFDVFKDITNSLLPNGCGRVFDHPADCAARFEHYLTEAMKNQDGILSVKTNPDGNCHILPVIGYDGTDITVYDPQTGSIETKAFNSIPFNRDCIIFKKTA
jgi:hypothetical protein